MEIVVGLSLRNLKPKIWDQESLYYLPKVHALMVSYADFDLYPSQRRKAMEIGLHSFLCVPDGVRVYLDNGSFAFHRKGREIPRKEYVAFVEAAMPDWYPPPQDYIPAPAMSPQKQRSQRMKTMVENLTYSYDGYVPVIHVGKYLDRYINDLRENAILWKKPHVAIGGIVPNLLRAPKALPYRDILYSLYKARFIFEDKHIHLFGVGGTATLHLAELLGIDSVDSSGWRNRAARGIIQLPGKGDRIVADLGKWRGRTPSEDEWTELSACTCPACKLYGIDGLKLSKMKGFCNRATHNLWTLFQETAVIESALFKGLDFYERWYTSHVENSVYEPLIAYTLSLRRSKLWKIDN